MKSITKIILCALTLVAANGAMAADEPLVVIRFNNPYVQYKNSLSMAVSEAVRVKEDIVFDVVTGKAVQNMGNQIASDIIALGVRPANINLRQSNYNNNEVMIFVR
jgi:hypothetical protein